MKPETEIRNLKREVRLLTKSKGRWQEQATYLEGRMRKAEKEVAEWKVRFDLLLRREEPKP